MKAEEGEARRALDAADGPEGAAPTHDELSQRNARIQTNMRWQVGNSRLVLMYKRVFWRLSANDPLVDLVVDILRGLGGLLLLARRVDGLVYNLKLDREVNLASVPVAADKSDGLAVPVVLELDVETDRGDPDRQVAEVDVALRKIHLNEVLKRKRGQVGSVGRAFKGYRKRLTLGPRVNAFL